MKKFETPPDSPPIIVIDPDDQPMWSSTRTVAPTPSSAIVQFSISDNFQEAVMLRTFPFSLSRESKTWLNELNEGTITSWNEMREAFISRYFSPSKFKRLLNEIHSFHQLAHETLVDAWLRIKEMLRTCYGHGLTKGTIIQIFYRGLDDPTQGILDTGGIFLYNTPNKAFQILEDKVLLKLDF
ncbi:reverse transcriptase domain-containing protein [Tanacetum coccineum]